ncbi:MAG: helix-turn-helix domain-containing protein [Myxococcota bacterium]
MHDPAEDATTEAILDAALREFGTRGFRGTSLSRVAANAGVSRPTLYARYADKAALFRAVVQSGFDAALAGVEAAAASKGPVEEELRAILEAYFGHLFDRYHGLPEIDELSRRQLDEAQDLVDAARARFKSLVSRWVRARRASARGNASLPAAQAVDLICLSPYALKDGSTSRVLYHKRLAALAQSVAAQLR